MEDLTEAHADEFGVTKKYCLTTGSLDLTVTQAHEDELFRLAERQNPKRAFLFVSTILGRHIPVDPRTHRASLNDLAEKALPLIGSGPVLVMGYAETAVGIGAGVFDCLRKKMDGRHIGYLHTTRHPIPDRDVWFTIEEGHSHATHHTIMKPGPSLCQSGPDATLVLVDDETTTGSTFAQLAAGLSGNGMSFGRIILVTLTDWSNGAAVEKVSSVSPGAEVTAVSLMSGSWEWHADPEAELPVLPVPGQAECPEWHPDLKGPMTSPRDGIKGQEMANGAYLAWKLGLPKMKRGENCLVIGTGEHVWQPFLYAEAHADEGREVGFIATTRSPILPGPVIEHKISFPDHFGLGLDMYLHNVNPDEWDNIVLFTETGIEGVHPKLRAALGKGHIVDRSGQIHAMTDF
jgi:hypothetical protein